jgi:hypothetical protein
MIPARGPRKNVPSPGGANSRTQAATEIVRLEYERERLTLALNQYTTRLVTTSETLKGVEKRIRWLMDKNDLTKQSGSR